MEAPEIVDAQSDSGEDGVYRFGLSSIIRVRYGSDSDDALPGSSVRSVPRRRRKRAAHGRSPASTPKKPCTGQKATGPRDGDELGQPQAYVQRLDTAEANAGVGSPKSTTATYLLRAGASPNQALGIEGCCTLRVISGIASVLGYSLTRAHGAVQVWSAPYGPFVTTIYAEADATTTATGDNGAPSESSNGVQFRGETPEFKEMSKLWPGFDGVWNRGWAVVEVSMTERGQMEGTYIAELLKSSSVPTAGMGTAAGFSIAAEDGRYPRFEYWSEWNKLKRTLEACAQADKAEEVAPRVLVCGEGGTGKSMCARCVVNRLLNAHSEVLFVETDVGQSELTPAGMVSLHRVTQPLLGHGVTHNRSVPLEARYFGATTPRDDARRYSDAVTAVLRKARRLALASGAPLVCNTDGWTGGTGARLLDELTSQLQPTVVVRMQCEDGNSGGSDARPPNGRGEALNRVAHCVTPCRRVLVTARRSRAGRPVMAPALMRELGFASYFGSALCRGIVHAVSLDDVCLAFTGQRVGAAQVLAAVNASPVALACTGGRREAGAWSVRGLGLVRGVDPQMRTLHVATPLSGDVLSSCDALVCAPGMSAPASFFAALARGERAAPSAPYVANSAAVFGAGMRSRTTLRR